MPTRGNFLPRSSCTTARGICSGTRSCSICSAGTWNQFSASDTFSFFTWPARLLAELGHLFLMPPTTVLFAASGGVAAVLMAYATILPELELTATTFVVPLRLKAKHLAYGAIALGAVLLVVDRSGTVRHGAYLGGCAAGWLYAHLLGFGRPSFLQRALHQRKTNAERYRQMNAEQFIAEEVDPLLEKISRDGSAQPDPARAAHLAQAREKLAEKV